MLILYVCDHLCRTIYQKKKRVTSKGDYKRIDTETVANNKLNKCI